MLRILHAVSSTALDAFRAAENAIDADLVADLEKMVERTRGELERLNAQFAPPLNLETTAVQRGGGHRPNRTTEPAQPTGTGDPTGA